MKKAAILILIFLMTSCTRREPYQALLSDMRAFFQDNDVQITLLKIEDKQLIAAFIDKNSFKENEPTDTAYFIVGASAQLILNEGLTKDVIYISAVSQFDNGHSVALSTSTADVLSFQDQRISRDDFRNNLAVVHVPDKETKEMYEEIASSVIKTVYEKGRIEIVDIGIENNELIVVFNDPNLYDAAIPTESALDVLGITTGVISGLKQENLIDSIVLICVFPDGRAVKVIGPLAQMLLSLEKDKNVLEEVSVQPF